MLEMAEVGRQLVWMGWQSIRIVGASLCYLHFDPAKCIFWYRLTRIVPNKVQRAIKWFCVCMVNVQNSLPNYVVDADNINKIKSRLFKL